MHQYLIRLYPNFVRSRWFPATFLSFWSPWNPPTRCHVKPGQCQFSRLFIDWDVKLQLARSVPGRPHVPVLFVFVWPILLRLLYLSQGQESAVADAGMQHTNDQQKSGLTLLHWYCTSIANPDAQFSHTSICSSNSEWINWRAFYPIFPTKCWRTMSMQFIK